MKLGRTPRQQPPPPSLLPPLLLPLLLLLLATGCAGLPQGSSSDGDLATAEAALAARLLQSAGGGSVGSRKRHVTRPHARPPPNPPPAGDPAAALKVIRRRKVLSPRAPRRGDDVTERTFQDSLRPPFLALLNATHFSLQPEFVLAQAAQHKMEPFRGFGEKLDMPGGAGRRRDFRAMLRSDNSAAERVNTTADEGLAGEPSERHVKVIVRRKKVRVLSAKDDSELDDEPPGAESPFVDDSSGKVTNSSETSPASKVSPGEERGSPGEERGAQTPAVKPRKPETNTERSKALPSSIPEDKSNVTGITPRRIASKRRSGRLLVPLPKTTHPPAAEKSEPTRKSEVKNKSTASSSRRTPDTTDATPRRPGARAAPLNPRRRPPAVDRSTTPRAPKTIVSPSTTTAKSPALRRLPATARRRGERFRSRSSRLRPASTTAGVSTTEAALVNREEKEVEKVLGLLGKIRNRSRSRPSFLPKRASKKDEESLVTRTTAAPTTTPVTTTRSSTARATTTTTTTTTETAATTTKTTTEKTTTTTKATTTTTTAAAATTSQSTTAASPTTTKATASAQVTPRVSSTASATTETTTQSSPEREASSSSTNASAASQLATATAPTVAASRAPSSSSSVTTSSTPTNRRQRPDTLRRTSLTSNADRPNLLARRLEERRHMFSLRSGPKAGQRPVLPTTLPPFPLLLSTIKDAQQRGLLGRNVTISVTFPRGTTGLIRSRPALSGARPNRLPPRQSPVEISSTKVTSTSPPAGQAQVRNKAPLREESASDVHQGSDDLSVNSGNGESRVQGGSESDVHRTVLGTSLETSVSIAVSPLEYRLRRVKLPPKVTRRPAVSGGSPSVDLEPLQGNSDAAFSDDQESADGASPEVKEEELGERGVLFENNDSGSVVNDTQGSSTVPVAKSSERPPVLESSVIETTEPPSRASDETSSSPSESERRNHGELSLSSTKDEKEADASTAVSPSEAADSTVNTASNIRHGSAQDPENISNTFPKVNDPDTNSQLTSTSEHSYHSSKGHAHLQEFSVISGGSGSSEATVNKLDSTDTDAKKPFLRRPSEEGFEYFSDTDGKETYSDYDGEDLTAEASTTMATFVRPTESEMARILSADDSATAPTSPSALPPVVHHSHRSEHHPLDDSASTEETAKDPSSPPSVTYATSSSPSSTTQSSSTTSRQARVLEVGAQPVSPDPEEPAAAGGPMYLVSLLFVVPVVAVLVWYLKKNHPDVQHLLPERLKSMLAHETPDTGQENFYPVEVDDAAGKPSTLHSHDTLARRRRWEHPRDTLRLQSVLGEGHFGQVWRAEVDNIGGHQGTLLVAVKNAKESATAKEQQDLMRELRIMQDLGSHPNVVTLLGCCTTEEPVLVIMEYMVFGKLLTYLRENRGRHNYYNFSHDSAVLTSPDLTLFACQVAAGMEYIAEKGIIHRDLAARNILVDHTKVCKVSDFGMSRSEKEISTEVFEQKHRGALPIRWMSPESLYHNTFNQPTDCWSFGILLWEIITLGSTPYPGLSAREVMRSVREGYRLERPDHCQPQLYQLASSCWTAEPSWRPTFTELRVELEILLEDQNQGYVDLDRFQEEIYSTLHKSSDEKV